MKEGTSTTSNTSTGGSTTDNGSSSTSASISSNVNDSIHVSGAKKIGSGQGNSHPMSINRTGIKNLVQEMVVVTRMKNKIQKIREELREVLSAQLREISVVSVTILRHSCGKTPVVSNRYIIWG